jgi:hypothetical protein
MAQTEAMGYLLGQCWVGQCGQIMQSIEQRAAGLRSGLQGNGGGQGVECHCNCLELVLQMYVHVLL